MKERKPNKEIIGRGELFFLGHPREEDVSSGYGLAMRGVSKEFLAGLLIVDNRPRPADPAWLQEVEETYGRVRLTASGERGILCQMQVEPESQRFLRKYPPKKAAAIQQALGPLLEEPPSPTFLISWDKAILAWCGCFAIPSELPRELSEVFEKTGYGSLAAETCTGIVHI